jgi:DNA replication and repair protein RecF
VVVVSGANGAGKTNLLEALHVGTQGFSPRTRRDARMIRLGATAARVGLRGRNGAAGFESEVTLGAAETRGARLNGDRLPSAEHLRSELRTLVFTPDRLAVVKGGPATRRAYLDRSLGRLLPGRASLPVEYATAVGQRNAALRRVAHGISSREALAPWTEAAASLGGSLVEARLEVISELATGFSEYAGLLGLGDATLEYDGEAPSAKEYEESLERDLERGVTSMGPHLHDLRVAASARDLRSYGSQGEQRIAVLALVLSEARALSERTGSAPLVLLDDVLSELDGDRRRSLAGILSGAGQVVVTAVAAGAYPAEPTQSLVVSEGGVRRA